MAGKTRNYSIKMLNVLMRYDRPLTTNEIAELIGCDRKTVYFSATTLELNGFGLEINRKKVDEHYQNTYKLVGIHGLNEV